MSNATPLEFHSITNKTKEYSKLFYKILTRIMWFSIFFLFQCKSL